MFNAANISKPSCECAGYSCFVRKNEEALRCTHCGAEWVLSLAMLSQELARLENKLLRLQDQVNRTL